MLLADDKLHNTKLIVIGNIEEGEYLVITVCYRCCRGLQRRFRWLHASSASERRNVGLDGQSSERRGHVWSLSRCEQLHWVIIFRAGLIVWGTYQRKAGHFSRTHSQDFLWRCTFPPKKLHDLFLVVVVMFKPTLKVQTSKQRVKNLAADRGPPGGGGLMVQPAQWIIRPC